MISVNSDLYQKFRNQPNFQAFADNQMGRLIAAQQKRYDPKFYGQSGGDLKPSNLYQQYLKESGMLKGGQERPGKFNQRISNPRATNT